MKKNIFKKLTGGLLSFALLAGAGVAVNEKKASPVNAEGTGNTYTKVTSAPTDWSGTYLFGYETSSTSTKLFNGVDGAADYVEGTLSGGVISDDEGAAIIEIKSMSGGYSVKLTSGDKSGNYIYGQSGKNSIQYGSSAVANTIAFSDGLVTLTSNSTSLRFNSNAQSGNRFRYYKTTTTGNDYHLLTLYKQDEGASVSSIAVSGQTSTFNQGDTFSFGGTVTATMSDATTKDVTSDCSFSGYNMNSAGSQTVTVTYKDTDIKTTYAITINADTLESITLGGSVTGKKNSAWNLSGVTATGHYSVGGDKVLSGFTPVTTTANPTEPGDYTVHVTVTIGGITGTKDYSVNIPNAHTGESEGDAFTVAEAMEHMFANNSSVTSLFYVRGILTANPDNTTYGNFYISDDGTSTTTIRVYGATASSSALKESSGKWTFTNPRDWSSNEATKNIVAGYEVVMHARLYMFNTTYEADGVVVSSSLPALNSIKVTTAPTKTEYEAGQSFNPAGMVVKGCYGVDGKIEKEISGYTVSPDGALAAGTTFVTISYTDGGVTKSTTQAITVSAPITDWEFKSIILSVGTGKTTYNIGDSFDKAGFSVVYTEHSSTAGKDRQTEVIDSVTINGFDSSAEKTCNITATYAGHTSNSISISVVDKVCYKQLMDASEIVEGMVIRIGSAANNAVASTLETKAYKFLTSVEASYDDGLVSVDAGLDFTIGKSGDYFTLTSSEGLLLAKSTGDLSLTDGVGTWSISIDENGKATILSSAQVSEKNNRFLFNVNSPRFKTYTSDASATMVLPEIYVVSVPTPPTAEAFATKFINDTNLICANTGNNRDALAAIWDGFAEEFGKLSSTEQGVLKNASADAAGSVIENAMARYDHIVSKYGLTNFIDGRSVVAARSIGYVNYDNNFSTTIIIVVSVVSLTTLAALLVIKRRKAIEK